MPDRGLRAVIWISSTEDETGQLAECATHGADRGYEVAAIVHGPWSEVWAMLDADLADVALVRSRRDMPAGRLPRLEIVADEQPARDVPEGRGPITGRGPARGQSRRTRRPRRLETEQRC